MQRAETSPITLIFVTVTSGRLAATEDCEAFMSFDRDFVKAARTLESAVRAA
jgi:hypothetical protein